MRSLLTLLAAGFLLSLCAAAAPKPVPRMQAVPMPRGEVSIQRDGHEVARLHYGTDLNRPFIFPIIGPSGRSLTRMGHPRDPESHSHHNSVWVSHQNVEGVSFWEDRNGNRVVHQRVLRYEDSDTEALVETENSWVLKDGTKLLRELRRVTIAPLEAGELLIVLDLQFEPLGSKDITLGETPFGLLGVRMAKTIGVHDGGGTIRNSEGGVDEEGCFRKPARWCDYSGPIAPGVSEGIALFDHPSNPHHPVPIHVRGDGWMGAATTFAGPLLIEPGKQLRVRYGLYVHNQVAAPEVIDARWKQFAETQVPVISVKR
jgi:hypothetical protein